MSEMRMPWDERRNGNIRTATAEGLERIEEICEEQFYETLDMTM